MPFTGLDGFPSVTAADDAAARKLQDAAPASNTTIKADFATTTTRRAIQWKATGTQPNTASGTPGAATGFGWQILKAEMNRTVDLPSRALISAGVWDFSVSSTTSQADAVGAAATIEVRVFRRSSAGAFTFLFSALSGTFSVLTASTRTTTWSSASQPAYLFATDETLHVEYWVNGQGVIVVGNIYTINLGADTWVNFPVITSQTVGIVDNHPRSYSAIGVGIPTTPTKYARLASKTAVGVGVATAPTKYARLAVKTSTGVGVPSRMLSIKPLPKLAVGVGVASSPVKYVRLASKIATGIGIASAPVKYVRLAVKSAVGVGIPSMTRSLQAYRSFLAVGIGVTPPVVRSVIAVRTFLAVGVGVASGAVKISLTLLNRVTGGGGGTTIIKKIIAIFDD